jgi:spore coat protein U-like protein
MKSFTKPAVFIFLTIAFSSSLFAQSSANKSVDVTASLVRGLLLETIDGSIDFPELILSGAASTEAITVGDANGANLRITSHPNRNVSISFGTASLSNSAWATPLGATVGNMTFTPSIQETGTSSTYNAGSANNVTSGSTVLANNDSGNGIIYLWIGGSMDVASNQAFGDYTGTLTVTVTY